MIETKFLEEFLRSRDYQGNLSQALWRFLKDEGYPNQINEGLFKYLGSLGYGGTLTDRINFWVENGATPPEPTAQSLPTVSTEPSAGWGFQRLNAQYEGPLFRAVRPSDSQSRVIGQTAEGSPDLEGFVEWAGNEQIQVDLVYDQYGMNNLTQTTANNRPFFLPDDAFRGKLAASLTFMKWWNIPAELTGDGRATTTVNIGYAAAAWNGGGIIQLGQLHSGDGSSSFLLGNGSGNNARARMLNKSFVGTGIFHLAHPQAAISVQGAAANVVHINDKVASITATSAGTWSGGFVGRDTLPHYFIGQYFGSVIYPAALPPEDVLSLKESIYSIFDVEPQPTTQIMMVGNSIVQGTAAARVIWGYPRQAQNALANRAEIVNAGRPGQSAAFAYGERAQYYAGRRTDRTRNLMTAPEPTNDIDGRTIANVAGIGQSAWDASVRPFITEAVAAGWSAGDILVPTTLPRNWTGDATLKAAKEAERAAYNTLVRDNAASLGYTVLDFAAIPAMANPLGPNYADGTHPNSTNFASGLEVSGNGYGYMAKLFADVVNARLAA